MDDKAFFNLIATSGTSRGGITFNLKTQNVSKKAQAILRDTQYKALAKQFINSPIVNAYYTNNEFKAKLNDVMSKLNITVID